MQFRVCMCVCFFNSVEWIYKYPSICSYFFALILELLFKTCGQQTTVPRNMIRLARTREMPLFRHMFTFITQKWKMTSLFPSSSYSSLTSPSPPVDNASFHRSLPADIKRLMAYAPAMNVEFIVSYFGTLSRETSIDVSFVFLAGGMLCPLC